MIVDVASGPGEYGGGRFLGGRVMGSEDLERRARQGKATKALIVMKM